MGLSPTRQLHPPPQPPFVEQELGSWKWNHFGGGASLKAGISFKLELLGEGAVRLEMGAQGGGTGAAPPPLGGRMDGQTEGCDCEATRRKGRSAGSRLRIPPPILHPS